MEIKINREGIFQWIEHIALEEKHNMKNTMAATSVAKLMQIREKLLSIESLSKFPRV
jgi:UDP-N-acetylmuramoylalanine--D-glutamate ligase